MMSQVDRHRAVPPGSSRTPPSHSPMVQGAVLRLLSDARPTGHPLHGTPKHGAEQQQKLPCGRTRRLHCWCPRRGSLASSWALWMTQGWALCGPGFTQVPLKIQRLLLSLSPVLAPLPQTTHHFHDSMLHRLSSDHPPFRCRRDQTQLLLSGITSPVGTAAQ